MIRGSIPHLVSYGAILVKWVKVPHAPLFTIEKGLNMKMSVVDFSQGGEGVTGLYYHAPINIKPNKVTLVAVGDYYHNKIDDYIAGFFDAVIFTGLDLYVDFYSIDENIEIDNYHAFENFNDIEGLVLNDREHNQRII